MELGCAAPMMRWPGRVPVPPALKSGKGVPKNENPPCLRWVKLDKTQSEHNASAFGRGYDAPLRVKTGQHR